jgi:tetratricopeptide (TPR) repeat protein
VIEVPTGGYVPNFRKRVSHRQAAARLQHTYALDLAPGLNSVYHPNPKAHHLYVEGSRLSSRGTPKTLRAAIQHFEESIAIDSNYALSHAGLSDAYLQLSSVHFPPHNAMDKARAAAEKAIELDSTLDKAHAALGQVHLRYDWDRQVAKDRVKIAMALNPKSADAHILYASAVATEGRMSEALSHLRHAQELDPFSVKARLQTQFTYLLDRDYEAAIEEGLKTLQLEPVFSLGRAVLGLAYSLHGDVTTGLDHLRRAAEQEDSPWQNLFLQHGYALAEERSQAMQLIRKLEAMAAQRYICAYEIGQAYAFMENQDDAFRWLDTALDERPDCMVFIEVEPWMDCLRADHRYEGVVKRLHNQPSCELQAPKEWRLRVVPTG